MWFNGLRCCDCENLDKNDRNKYGEAYCPIDRNYVSLDSHTCREFIPNFYVMTVFCNINGFPYDCFAMTTLIHLRDTYMLNNETGKEFLKEYENIGPILALRLKCDGYKTDIVKEMEEEYIIPAIDFATSGRFEDAQNSYIEMIEKLKRRYGYLPLEEKTKRL